MPLNPLGTLPKKGSAKRIRNEICLSTERSEGELFHFPLCTAFFREPEGQRLGVVSFASFSCRHKKRKWPAGASPGQSPRSANRIASPKCKPYRITESANRTATAFPPFKHPALILIKASRYFTCFRARSLHAQHPMLIPYSISVATAAAIFSNVYRFHHCNRNRIQRLQVTAFHNSAAVDTCQNSEQADT